MLITKQQAEAQAKRNKQMRRLVVAGTGRSGTGYMAAALSAAGLKAGHENVYSPNGVSWRTWEHATPYWDADCSWLSVPHLAKFKADSPGGIIVHIARDPLKVISSLVRMNVLSDAYKGNPYTEYKRRHCPESFGYADVIDRAAHFWVHWNRRTEPHADRMWQIEKIGVQQLNEIFEVIGYQPPEGAVERAIESTPTNTNTYGPGPTVTWDDITPELASDVQALAGKYGYT